MRKGMRSSDHARHAARNMRASFKKIQGVVGAVFRRIQAAFLALAMIVSVAIVLPLSAKADDASDDHLASSGCSPMLGTTFNAFHVDFKAQIRQADGSSKDVSYTDPDAISNIAPGSNIEIGLRGEFADRTIIDKEGKEHLCWQYPLPMNYESVSGMQDMYDYTGTGVKAKLSIVHDVDNKAYLQIDFNKDWVETNDRHFQFNYPLTVDGSKLNIPAGGSGSWRFPGITRPVRVTIAGYDISGNKNCWYDSGVSVTENSGNLGMKCEVTLNAESEMKNFKFSDEWNSDLIVHKDLKFEGPDGEITSGFTTNYSDSSMSFVYSGDMPKGSYKISYTAEVKAGAASDGYNFTNAKNTAKWHADGLDNWHESSFTPYAKSFDGGGSDSGDSKNYTYVRKSGSAEKNADGKYVATWQVYLNSGTDKFDLSKGFVLRDELQSNQTYNMDFGLKIYQGHGTSGEEAKTLLSGDFSKLIKNNGEEISQDENGNKRYCNGAQCFVYDFGNNDLKLDNTVGQGEVTLVYQTILDTNAAGSFNNLARVDENGHERENAGASVSAGDVSAGSLISKSVSQTATKVGENSQGSAVYEVPWTIIVDPTKASQNFTDLNFYEDWVDGTSDGNTQHMWYTGSTLKLKVEECTPNESASDGCTWNDVTGKFRVKYRNGSADLPDRKDNYDFPEGWYRNNAGETDGNSLHDGVPAFKLEDNGYKDTLRDANGNSTGVYTKKLRITYNTLFDGKPDSYINYAKFTYNLAGQYKQETVSDTFKYNKGNYVGKAINAETEGKDDYTDKATFQTVDEIAQEYVDRGLAANVDEAKTLVEAKYPQGRWVAHWRVWANGTKSWWINGYSGLRDLSDVKQISLHDALPDGWSIAEDRPIYGRFVSDQLSPEDKDKGVNEHWETFRLATSSQCGGAAFSYNDENGEQQTVNPVCATYALSKGAVDFTVPNDGSLMSYYSKADNDEPDAARPAGLISKQARSIVVFSYDTYITPETLSENGYELGNTNVYTNHATAKFDNTDVVDTPASGNVTVSTSNVLTKEKRGGENYNKGEAVYQVGINNPNQYMLAEGDNIELVDSLDPNAQYAALDQTDGVTTFIAAFLDGDTNKVVDAGQITYKIKQDPDTLAQTMTITIPKTLTWTKYNSVDKWDNGAPVHWKDPRTETDAKGTVTNPTSLSILYRVRARGIPGQRVQISNKVKLAGTNTWVSTQPIDADVRLNSGIVSAAGKTTLTKLADDDGSKLSGAEFKICKVDLGQPVTSQLWGNCSALQTVTTGTNGTVTLTDSTDGLHYGSAYVAIETKAPTGYQMSGTPYYFTLPQPEKPAAGEGTIPTDCQEATCATQYNSIAEWAKSNKVQFFGATDGDLTIYDEPLEAAAEWQKADSGKLQITNDSVNVSDFLAGSTWKFENADAACASKNADSTAKQASMPCVFTVKDNGKYRAAKDGTPAQLADENTNRGQMKIGGFPYGVTYKVTEAQAPDGYAKRSETYLFGVDADGNASWSVEDEPSSTSAEVTNYQRMHGLYVFDVTSGTIPTRYNVITDNPLLRTMPSSGLFGGAGPWLVTGLALGVLSFSLFISTGKERRPRASHSRV